MIIVLDEIAHLLLKRTARALAAQTREDEGVKGARK
jgi:hypothetical protein